MNSTTQDTLRTADLNVSNASAQQHTATDASASRLLSSLATDIGDLMRGELHLARAEISESVDHAKSGAAGMGVGIAVLLAGVLTLIAFLVLGVADWFDLQLWVGALIVGVIATLIGAVLVKKGTDQFSAKALAPSRTQAALSKDKKLVEEKLS